MESGLRLVDTGRPEAPPPVAPPPAPPADIPTSEGITFTLKAAAEACLVDPQTIRRRLKHLEQQGDLHGAHRNDDGSWTIPLRALHAAGLNPGKPSPPPNQEELSGGHASPLPPDISMAASQRIAALEHQVQLAEVLHRAELAEAALEAERRSNADLRRALALAEHQLMGAPPAPSAEQSAEPATLDSAASPVVEDGAASRLVPIATPSSQASAAIDPPKRQGFFARFGRRPHGAHR